jgi:hypothetical protein
MIVHEDKPFEEAISNLEGFALCEDLDKEDYKDLEN